MTLLFILFSLPLFFTILACILSSCFGFTNYLSSILSFFRFSMISIKKISHSFFVAPFVSHIQRARFASSILTTTNSSLSYVVCRMSPLSYVACLSNALSPPMHPTKKELFFIPYSPIPYSLIPYSLYPISHSPPLIPHLHFLFLILYSLFRIPISYTIYLPGPFLTTTWDLFSIQYYISFFTTINTFSNFIPASNNSLFFLFRISYFIFVYSFIRPCVRASVPPFTLSFVR